MGFNLFGWLRDIVAPSPAKLTSGQAITSSKPLWEQFQRIGGGLTPAGVSTILREADAGQPARFVDLVNESRQKDGHMQSVLSTREAAPALTDLDFIEPEDATDVEKDAVKTCRRIVDGFRNWSELIEHINGSLFGHATAELRWEKQGDGFVLPTSAKRLHPRDFIFTEDTGELRYSTGPGDRKGVDLLAENPGRIIQVQRRIVGDVQVREGLGRILVWPALFRNWDIREWVLLGEIGWKPWRKASYPAGWDDDQVNALMRTLEKAMAMGLIVYPDDVEIEVEWPKGQATSQGGSTHREMFETLGREMSKAALGQTTSIESGPNGTRSDTQVRDGVRTDIKELDCRVIAGPLLWHMFQPAVALNHGPGVRCPAPWFQTEEAGDQLQFSKAISLLAPLMKIPARHVRDEMGIPEPIEGEEVLVEIEEPDADPSDPAADEGSEEEAA